MRSPDNLNSVQLDALKEISNIGIGHAATSLSQLLGKKISMSVPKIILTPITEVTNVIGGPEELVIGIYLKILGQAKGSILIIFPQDSASSLLNLLTGKGLKDISELDLNAQSALKELGNILSSSYLTALSNLLKMCLIPSIPGLAFDMMSAVVDFVLIELGEVGDYALVVETTFTEAIANIKGHIFLLPDPQTLEIIFKAINM
ncbi:MAG: chemotaxis protein CheC [bacterium]